jgi:hypothetical protein
MTLNLVFKREFNTTGNMSVSEAAPVPARIISFSLISWIDLNLLAPHEMQTLTSLLHAGVKINPAAGGSCNDQSDLLVGWIGAATGNACTGRQKRGRDDESKNLMHASSFA